MSKLKVDLLETVDGLESETLSNILKALPTAWVDFLADGTINSSYNIASVTNTAAGQYAIVFSVPMANTTFAVITSAREIALDRAFNSSESGLTARTVNGFSVSTTRIDDQPFNTPCSVAVYGGTA